MSSPIDPPSRSAIDGTRTLVERPPAVNSGDETREPVPDPSTDAGLATPTLLLLPLPAKYELRKLLGRGGMGEVIHAYDTQLKRDVALKFMRRHAAVNPMLRRRFQEEARILAQLKHRSVVKVHEQGEIDGRPYFAMEYLSGATLHGRRAEFRTSAAVSVAVVVEVCAGVQHAHEHGIYHRDLKASNVVFDGRWPVVTDFGCAKWEEGELSTQGLDLFGTPSHMAPEVWEYGSKEHDARADLWSLGVMLYHLLAGELPYPDDPRTPDGRAALLERDPTPVRQCHGVVPGVDERLERIVLKALSRNPDDRQPTVAEFAAALEVWLADTDRVLAVGDRQAPQKPLTFGRARLWARLALVGTMSTVLATVVWFRNPPIASEKNINISVNDRLNKPGDFVELVGATGMPTESVRDPQGFVGTTSLSPDKFCEIESARVFLLELGDQPLPFPFRLRAEARLTTTARDTKVGVYTSRRAHMQPDGTFVHVAFLNSFGQMNSTQHIPRFTGKDGWGAFPARIALTNSMLAPTDGEWVPATQDPPTADESPGPFHVVEIDVHPSSWQARLDGQTARPKKTTTAVAATLAALTGLNERVTQPPFGHGFGLFVFQGGGQFRNVRIIRLAD